MSMIRTESSHPPVRPPVRPPVVGRLAPSPTGTLHLGNLATSLLAWADVRRRGGHLILRIEDLDPPRVVPGAAEQLASDLRWLGLDWDEGSFLGATGTSGAGPAAPYDQASRSAHYAAARRSLAERELVYPCTCSRREVEEALSAPHNTFDPTTGYPGTCAGRRAGDAAGLRAAGQPFAWRFRARGDWTVHDRVCGATTADLAVTPGDFVVERRDGLYAYQLAVVVDDGLMGVTTVLRGRDLLDSTPSQRALAAALGYPPPETVHVPLWVGEDGRRLAKRDGSAGRAGLEQAGWSPAGVVGAIAALLGFTDHYEPLSAGEFATLWQDAPLGTPVVHVPAALFAGPRAFANLALTTGVSCDPDHHR